MAVSSPAPACHVDRRFDHLDAPKLDSLAHPGSSRLRGIPWGCHHSSEPPAVPRVAAPAGHPMGLAPQQRTARRTQGRPACGASVGMAPLARRVHDVGTMRDAIDARSARAARGRGGAHATAPARRVTGTALAALVWTLSGALVLVRPIETFVGRLLFRLRRPAREELNHLTPIWLGVCRRAGADPGRYLLRVEQGETLNAFAIGGHFVAVTRAALRLPDDMLEAVIAHELGHHRYLHPVATGLGWWYGLPFQAADWLLRRIRLTTAFLARVFAYLRAGSRDGGIDGLLGLLAALVVVGALVIAGVAAVLILGVVWLPLALLVWTSRLLSAALSRAAEYAADRHAVELGFGPGLTRMLELLQQTEQRSLRPRGPRALLRSHPTCQARLAAIRDLTVPRSGASR